MISISGRILAVSKPQIKAGVSDRLELYVRSEEGELHRATLWHPLSNMKISVNFHIRLIRFMTTNFAGQCLSSKSFSQVKIISESTLWPQTSLIVCEIKGGIQIESVEAMKVKSRVSESGVAFGFIKGTIVAIENKCIHTQNASRIQQTPRPASDKPID